MQKIALFLLFVTLNVGADQFAETRYCGVVRNADGTIHRSTAVLVVFQKIHPCPSTGKTVGVCPGWSRNHDIPLACGGCDSVSNISWMRNDVKKLVDSYERKINALNPPVPDTAACINTILK